MSKVGVKVDMFVGYVTGVHVLVVDAVGIFVAILVGDGITDGLTVTVGIVVGTVVGTVVGAIIVPKDAYNLPNGDISSAQVYKATLLKSQSGWPK